MKLPHVGNPVGAAMTLAIPPTWKITSRPLDQPFECSSLSIQNPETKMVIYIIAELLFQSFCVIQYTVKTLQINISLVRVVWT